MALESVSLVITRTELGLADLELNRSDHIIKVGQDFQLGSQQVSHADYGSPQIEGMFDVVTKREMVTLDIPLWVDTDTLADTMGVVKTIKNAFQQQSYTLTYTYGGISWTWECEAANMATDIMNAQMIEKEVKLNLQVPAHPVSTQDRFFKGRANPTGMTFSSSMAAPSILSYASIQGETDLAKAYSYPLIAVNSAGDRVLMYANDSGNNWDVKLYSIDNTNRSLTLLDTATFTSSNYEQTVRMHDGGVIFPGSTVAVAAYQWHDNSGTYGPAHVLGRAIDFSGDTITVQAEKTLLTTTGISGQHNPLYNSVFVPAHNGRTNEVGILSHRNTRFTNSYTMYNTLTLSGSDITVGTLHEENCGHFNRDGNFIGVAVTDNYAVLTKKQHREAGTTHDPYIDIIHWDSANSRYGEGYSYTSEIYSTNGASYCNSCTTDSSLGRFAFMVRDGSQTRIGCGVVNQTTGAPTIYTTMNGGNWGNNSNAFDMLGGPGYFMFLHGATGSDMSIGKINWTTGTPSWAYTKTQAIDVDRLWAKEIPGQEAAIVAYRKTGGNAYLGYFDYGDV